MLESESKFLSELNRQAMTWWTLGVIDRGSSPHQSSRAIHILTELNTLPHPAPYKPQSAQIFASMASNPLPHPIPDTPTTSYTDPTFSLLNTSCLDLLLIELVPMAYRITSDLAAREEAWTHGGSSTKNNRLSGDASSTAVGPVGGNATATVDEEEAREAVFHRLENLGYRVGLGIVERYVYFLSFHPILSTDHTAHN
jgi:hypothetical protein